MADDARAAPQAITIVPPGKVPAPPYANATFTYVVTPHDVNVVFLRVPLLPRPTLAELIKANATSIEGEVIGSISLPRTVAIDLANKLLEVVKP